MDNLICLGINIYKLCGLASLPTVFCPCILWQQVGYTPRALHQEIDVVQKRAGGRRHVHACRPSARTHMPRTLHRDVRTYVEQSRSSSSIYTTSGWLATCSVHVVIITHLGSSITMYVCIYNPCRQLPPGQEQYSRPRVCVLLNHQGRSIPYCLVYRTSSVSLSIVRTSMAEEVPTTPPPAPLYVDGCPGCAMDRKKAANKGIPYKEFFFVAVTTIASGTIWDDRIYMLFICCWPFLFWRS